METEKAVPVAVVDSILEEMYAHSIQAVPVTVGDSFLEDMYAEIV